MDLAWRGEQKKAAKELFGRPLRVLLAAWVLESTDGTFYLTEAQDAMRAFSEAPSGVHKELRLFESHGMLTMVQTSARVYFTKTKSPLWHAFKAVGDALGVLSSNQAGETSRTKP